METALITWWSAVHAATGLAFGVYFAKQKRFNNRQSYGIALFLLILWEYFERYALAGIEFGNELIRNRIADVIIGYAAFVLMYEITKTFKR